MYDSDKCVHQPFLNLDWDSFELHFSLHGFDVGSVVAWRQVKIPGDGNCLYASIVFLLNLYMPGPHLYTMIEVRQLIGRHMLEDHRKFKPHWSGINPNIADAIDRIDQTIRDVDSAHALQSEGLAGRRQDGIENAKAQLDKLEKTKNALTETLGMEFRKYVHNIVMKPGRYNYGDDYELQAAADIFGVGFVVWKWAPETRKYIGSWTVKESDVFYYDDDELMTDLDATNDELEIRGVNRKVVSVQVETPGGPQWTPESKTEDQSLIPLYEWMRGKRTMRSPSGTLILETNI